MLGHLGSIDITSLAFYPPKIPRQVFLPPGYGFAIWFECLISQFSGLTWQAGLISFIQQAHLTKQVKSVLFSGLT